MRRYSNMDELVKSLTSGNLYEMKLLSITTGVVEAGMTTKEAVEEQLDIVFDEVLRSSPALAVNRQSLEKNLRNVGEYWASQLRGES